MASNREACHAPIALDGLFDLLKAGSHQTCTRVFEFSSVK